MGTSAYERLRELLSSAYSPGDSLSETVLAEQLGVSRTPVRESLIRLITDGLVERKGQSIFVASHSPEDILDEYEVRAFCEENAARLAALRHTELDLSRIRQAHEAVKKVVKADEATQKRTIEMFHHQLWLASHNKVLVDILERMNFQFQSYRGAPKGNRWKDIIAEHTALIEAVAARDADEAARIASSHINSARNIRLKMYEPALGSKRYA